MAKTPEGKVKEFVDGVGAQIPKLYAITPTTGGYGASGHSDRIWCVPDKQGGAGYMVVIETKAGNKTPTVLQKKRILAALGAGAFGAVVNAHNHKAFAEWVWAIHTGSPDVQQCLLPDGYTLAYDNKVGL
jgi:hypothetical protein